MKQQAPLWSVPRAWQGQACFIIGGGASVLTQDLKLLAGRKVIAINSSCFTYPSADYVFFGDYRWWHWHHKRLGSFAGRLVTSAKNEAPGVLRLTQRKPPGLSTDPGAITMRWTSMQGAINLAVLLGVKAIVTLGLDGKISAGRKHHHSPHPVPHKPNCFDWHRRDLATVVAPLKQLGISLYNASPGSAYEYWQVMTLPEAIALVDGEQRKAA